MDHVHTRFRYAREARGLTQRAVARHFNVDKGTVCRWDTGATSLSIAQLIEIAAFFECDRAWLAFGEGDPPPKVVASKPAPSKTGLPRKHRSDRSTINTTPASQLRTPFDERQRIRNGKQHRDSRARVRADR